MAKKISLNRKIYQYLLLFFVVIAAIFFFIHILKPEIADGLVTRVIDGDTIVVVQDGEKRKVRLIYIDAPEMDQIAFKKSRKGKEIVQLGLWSKVYLQKLIEGKTVSLKYKSRDRYQRDLAVVYLGEENINLKMVRDGYAVVYWFARFTGKHTKEMFLRAFNDASQLKKGIWAVDGFQDPYHYRKNKK